MKSVQFATPFVVMILLGGCGGDEKPPAAPVAEMTAPAVQPEPEKPGDVPTQAQISISDDIKKACGLTDDEAFFSFNSAKVGGQEHGILAKVAKCFDSGPLAGKNMRLVGHADPRGESEYNMTLGGRRADNVKSYISSQGLADGRIQTTSRGAMDATGTDEASWAKDRRVDMTIAN
jgi:peptidoglycan-associated lipoprotein